MDAYVVALVLEWAGPADLVTASQVSRSWRDGAMLATVTTTFALERSLLQPISMVEGMIYNYYQKFVNYTIPITAPLHPSLRIRSIRINITQHQYMNFDNANTPIPESEVDFDDLAQATRNFDEMYITQKLENLRYAQNELRETNPENKLSIVRYKESTQPQPPSGGISEDIVNRNKTKKGAVTISLLKLTRGKTESKFVDESSHGQLCLAEERVGLQFGCALQNCGLYGGSDLRQPITLVSQVSGNIKFYLKRF
ncbi:hypothetical protein HDU83_005545 [Entophlyctis luteolus]|nr:hypothetical protein HDU83_005545 [Entophlyctis luteolus]